MEILDPSLILFLLALVAGFVDAVAGGGGLITVPALLWAGLNPLEALATNKAQGVFGTLTATANFVHIGCDLRRATAHTKRLNFTSNLAALLLFLPGGHIVWTVGLTMAAGQFIGAWIGSHLVLRHGTRLIRPMLVAASLAVSVKPLADRFGH